MTETAAHVINKLGIIGAGQMGNGIAHVGSLAGLDIVMLDADPAALDRAMGTIAKNMERQVSKNQMAAADRDAAIARIKTGTDYALFNDCDLVVEAATENEAIKHKIFQTLVPHLRADALVASNTSSISITRLAAATDRPAKFIGMHFFNPVPVMKLVEVIRGIATDEPTFQATVALARRMGKTPASAIDSPAFIVNRVLCPMLNEAIFAVFEGVGTVESVDAGLKLGANHPMGPLELADFVGLDTLLAVMKVLYEGFSDSKYRPCPLLIKYVEAGWLGRKTGRGFYDYSHTPPVPTR